MKRFLTLIFFIFLPTSLYAIQENDFFNFMQNIDLLNYKVLQEKYVKSINQKFTTNAFFCFKKEKGFVYKQADYKFVSTKKAYCENNIFKSNLEDLPYFNEIKELIEDLLNNNLEKTKEAFEIIYKDSAFFIPKQKEMADWVEKFEFKIKNNDLKFVKIYYANKNYIVFNFLKTDKDIQNEIICKAN